MRVHLTRFTLVPLLLVLASCAMLGIHSAQSFEQKVAYAAQINTSVLSASTAALRASQISSADHEQVIKMSGEAKALTDSARLLSATDPSAANAKLTLATAVLTQLQSYLNSRKGT